ncbi:MAG: uroporphyrinogen decarboxylase family protein [Candidatus Coatesbacteria bacterium]
MSYRIGIDALHLKPTPRLAHTEYCSNHALMQAVERETGKPFNEAWELDYFWYTNDGPVEWATRGRTTDMGHGEFEDGGRDRRDPKPSPFRDVEEVWAFDAVAEYGLPDLDELVAYYEREYAALKKAGDWVAPGGYYKTLVSGAIEAFGWDRILEAAVDQQKFDKVLDSFFRLSMHHARAWAKTSIEVFNCHDDFVWAGGSWINPDFTRGAIIPRYRELWKILHDAGKLVVFTSDGDYTKFVDDVVAAGAQGLTFEPLTSFDEVVKRHAGSIAIMGSKVDTQALTMGPISRIEAQVDATLALVRGRPGVFVAVGSHIPSNVPVENALAYFARLRAGWFR